MRLISIFSPRRSTIVSCASRAPALDAMFSSKPKFDSNKCKVQLKMLINRINLLTSKKANLAKAEKRKVAMLLREDKEHNARILVEAIIREDYTLEAYDLIKQYTEMLIA